MIFISGGAADAPVLDAATQYLRAMGFFYWVLGILSVARMATQGLGYAGLAIFSGVVEMAARVDRQPGLRAGVRLRRHLLYRPVRVGVGVSVHRAGLRMVRATDHPPARTVRTPPRFPSGHSAVLPRYASNLPSAHTI